MPALISGYIAVILSFLIYLQNKRSNILFLKLITNVLWIIHNILIGGYTGALTTTFSVLRETLFLSRKFRNKKSILIIFIIFFIVSGIITFAGWQSIFPVIASVTITIGFYNKNPKIIKLYALISSFCMLIYGIYYKSSAIIINEILTESSIIISFLYLIYKKVFKKI